MTNINEQAQRRVDAITTCMDLGDCFIEHFHKVWKEGIDSPSFSHHCSEMQAWLDKCRKIKLQSTKRFLTSTNLMDWFFTACGLIDEDNGFYTEEEISAYAQISKELSEDRSVRVIDVITKILRR